MGLIVAGGSARTPGMDSRRSYVATVAGLRIAYGIGLLVAPRRLARSWLGPTSPATDVALRGVGIREIAVHGLLLGAALTDAPLRPLLAISIAGDLGDVASTAAAGSGALPDGAIPKTAAAAGGSALLSLAAVAVVQR
jgi:hypothetical protein